MLTIMKFSTQDQTQLAKKYIRTHINQTPTNIFALFPSMKKTVWSRLLAGQSPDLGIRFPTDRLWVWNKEEMFSLVCREAVLFRSSQTALELGVVFLARKMLCPPRHQAHTNPARLMPAVYHHHAQMWYSIQVIRVRHRGPSSGNLSFSWSFSSSQSARKKFSSTCPGHRFPLPSRPLRCCCRRTAGLSRYR